MKITDKLMSDILSDMIVLVDTREKKNQHILDFFEEQGIKYQIEKLDTADYTFILPNYAHIDMDRHILIEKKNSLDEIAGNFAGDRDRFQREFERVTSKQKIHLVIENATWKKLLKGSYRSKLTPKSFMASLMTWNIRYGCPVWFVGEDESPVVIYGLMRYELLEHLKNLRKEQDALDNLSKYI